MASKLFDLSRITNIKKRKKAKKGKKVLSRLQQYADRIEKNLPASEIWFRERWIKDMPLDPVTLYRDQFNIPLGQYIPDVINIGYKYIIEIDGSIHNSEMQRWKDSLKDKAYAKRGYTVFRLVPYDNDKYFSLLEAIRKHISMKDRRY